MFEDANGCNYLMEADQTLCNRTIEQADQAILNLYRLAHVRFINKFVTVYDLAFSIGDMLTIRQPTRHVYALPCSV